MHLHTVLEKTGFGFRHTICGFAVETAIFRLGRRNRNEKQGEIEWSVGGQRCLGPLPLSILVLRSHWEMAISRRWVLKMKAGKEKQKESERKESLFRHLHQPVVRRVMNLAPLLPSNQWLTHTHTTQDKHTHKIEISQVATLRLRYSSIIRPSSQLQNVYTQKMGCTCIIHAKVMDHWAEHLLISRLHLSPGCLAFPRCRERCNTSRILLGTAGKTFITNRNET